MQLSRDLFSSDIAMAAGTTFASSTSSTSGSAAAAPLGSALNFAQWLGKEFPRIMWFIILCRVAGYCVKNYYMINRQAVKRTTTYAGKHAAFSAELEAAEKLKKTAKDKK
jgi:hypothetical protein